MASASDPDFLMADDDADVLVSGEAVAIDVRPTPFVLRGAGLIIDWLVYFGLGTALLIWVVYPILFAVVGKDSDAQKSVALAMSVVMLVVVPIVVELLSHGKSLGKLAVGARIVRDDGGAIGFRHAFIRALIGVVEIYALFGGGAVITALFNSRSKRLGDLLAGTYSQYERTSAVVTPIFGVPVELTEWARTADVARMPDRLARRISMYLANSGAMTPFTRERVSRDLASEAAAWVYPVPATHPELFLAGVIAMRRDREYAGLVLEKERLVPLGPALTGLPHDFPERG